VTLFTRVACVWKTVVGGGSFVPAMLMSGSPQFTCGNDIVLFENWGGEQMDKGIEDGP
jgi:hypothetical protein